MADHPQDLARASRERLIRQERHALRRTLEGWRRVRAEIAEHALKLAEAAETARGRGEEPRVSWLLRQRRYDRLLVLIEARLGELAQAAGRPITALQRQAIEEAQTTMLEGSLFGGPREARLAVSSTWNALPVNVTELMIGNTAGGRPLGALLEEVAPGARRSAETKLASGIARGVNPRVVARELAGLTDTAYTRLTTITRTEYLRVQREAARQTILSNPGVLTGWTWTSARDRRVCMSCLAMDGTEHRPEEVLDDHPAGRCAMAPRSRSWSELGFPEGRDPVVQETGRQWYERLPESDRVKVAGPGKAGALVSGEIGWDDLVHRSTHPLWGTMRREASLRDARASAAAA